MISPAEMKNWFSYHPPTDEQVLKYELIRNNFRNLAESLNAVIPDCADKTAAFRDLRNCVMQFNLAIACNEPDAITEHDKRDIQTTDKHQT